jgi:CRISPR-associated protein Csy2
MTALRRKLGPELDLDMVGVGIINHHYQAQTNGDYVQRFNLSRNPLNKDGSTAAIVEEGRIHLELSLVFGLALGDTLSSASQPRWTNWPYHPAVLHTLRVAGGSILPGHGRWQPRLTHLPENTEDQQRQFRQLRRWLMPGYALVARDDLLPPQLPSGEAADDSRLDAWLDQCRLNHYPVADEQGQ